MTKSTPPASQRGEPTPEQRARIFYGWWGTAHFKNRKWTLLAPDGRLEDYGSRKHCVEEAKGMKWRYQVERHSRKHRGKITILESNL